MYRILQGVFRLMIHPLCYDGSKRKKFAESILRGRKATETRPARRFKTGSQNGKI